MPHQIISPRTALELLIWCGMVRNVPLALTPHQTHGQLARCRTLSHAVALSALAIQPDLATPVPAGGRTYVPRYQGQDQPSAILPRLSPACGGQEKGCDSTVTNPIALPASPLRLICPIRPLRTKAPSLFPSGGRQHHPFMPDHHLTSNA